MSDCKFVMVSSNEDIEDITNVEMDEEWENVAKTYPFECQSSNCEILGVWNKLAKKRKVLNFMICVYLNASVHV